MEQPPPFIPDYFNSIRPMKKPSNTISWLGFSFSLFAFLLLCITCLTMVISHDSNAPLFSSVLMMLMFIGTPLGLTGLILSIVGLVKASNRGGKKWIGICGLIFTGLSILSFFAPFVIVAALPSDPMELNVSDSMEDEVMQNNEIVLQIDGCKLKCYDNRNKVDKDPYETTIYDTYLIKKELEVWFTMHKIEKDDFLILKVSKDTDYSQVSDLMDALTQLGMTNFQLTP